MKWSFRIARVGGTEIRVHVTFFLLIVWVASSYLATSGAAQAIGSVIFVCALFTCVILHELGHAAAAKRYGISTPDITLLPIGGLARLDRIPESPKQELVIAIAGPLVNVAIAGALLAALGFFPEMRLGLDMADPQSILPNLLLVNLWLIIFNMIPAFPMDGGRVLRSILAMLIDRNRATKIAAVVGQSFALVGGLFGLMIRHPFLILIAVFVFMSAGAEANLAKTQNDLEGIPVSAALITDYLSLPTSAKLGEAVETLLASPQEDFPILDDSGNLAGILTRRQLTLDLANHGIEHPISEVELRHPDFLEANEPLFSALARFHTDDCQTLPVRNAIGDLAGILTVHNLSEFIVIHKAMAARH